MKQLYIALILLLPLFSTAQEWEAVAPVPDNFRTDHSFGFGLNGQGYLVTGGNFEIGRRYNNFYSYDPTEDLWTRKDDFPGAPRGFAIGDIYEGKAYFGFGASDTGERLKDLWVYDPDLDEWTELSPCDCIARTHPAFVISDGVIYVGLGGGDFGNLNDWWAYDIASDTWEQKAQFPSLPRHHPFMFSADGYPYVGFGHGDTFISNQWYKYDPATDTWEEKTTLPAEGRVAGTQFSYDGKGYVLSGDGDDHDIMPTGEFFEYDPAEDAWTQLTPHPGPSRWAPASFIVNDEVYLINGWRNGYPSEVWKYRLGGNATSTKDDLATGIEVYPNPFQTTVTMPAIDEKATVVISTSDGKVVYNQVYTNDTLDLGFLPKGTYVLEVIATSTTKRQLIVKQ